MQSVVDGIRKFQREVYPKHKEEFQQLATGQDPDVLFIGCSDSRVDPNLLIQSKPGELFVLRNAGNVVPPYGASTGGEAATVEYAVRVLKVKTIVVCGHSGCGAIGAMLDPDSAKDLPAVSDWLKQLEAARRTVADHHAEEDEKDLLQIAVRENVLQQLANLMTHPTVASSVRGGELQIQGCFYEIGTGNFDLTTVNERGAFDWEDINAE